MKTQTCSLLRVGDHLFHAGRAQPVVAIGPDRLGTGIRVKLRSGTRLLLSHTDRCRVR